MQSDYFRQHKRLTDICSEGLCVLTPKGKFLQVNASFIKMTGYSEQELLDLSIQDLDKHFCLPSTDTANAPIGNQLTTQLQHKNGSKIKVNLNVLYQQNVHDNILLNCQKVTHEPSRPAKNSIIENIFNNSTEAIVVTDNRGEIILTNTQFTHITGYNTTDVSGQTLAILKSGRHNNSFYQEFWHELNTKGVWSGEIWNKRKNGEIYPEWLNISSIRDANDEISYFIAQFSDISSIKRSENIQQFQAYHDPLTKLPNRRLLFERLAKLEQHDTVIDSTFAVLFCDLDRFKTINDTLGHNVGDEVLKAVADTLKGALRNTDTIARSGGDEFIIVIEGNEAIQHLERIAAQILAKFDAPIETKYGEFFISFSIGISKYPTDSSDIRELISFADIAMYQVKRIGGNNFCIFDPKQKQNILHKIELENIIHQSIDNKEFEVWYQPQINAKTREVYGVECLLRWQHPQHGFVSPELFIPIAERNGLIKELGEFVLTTACHQLRQWQINDIFTGMMAINVSPRQFDRDNLVGLLRKTLAEAAVPAHCIEIEVTESIFAKEDNFHISILEEIRNLGAKIAIDDFGTGYSSLARLKQLPIDNLKIDKSFIDHITSSDKDLSIVNALCLLSRSFNIDIIAEGVEHQQQANLLQQLGCHNHQGYLYGKPMPAKAFEQWLINFSLSPVIDPIKAKVTAITTN
ncbi:GGDEF domain-containing protein [Thalassotalea insulae]|uniref:GGDEF domain-containing protein n=1 Tax=Thalassotalea insulae TaxID=2056778 RepID=A0ABQ6GVW5_9GAMM|nr:GGDEF and EAL domain-containing protein [Thalassotalea insulae]GLX79344.1 GGDEF domain-containing protein [Thalassotalea insulae]